MSIFIDANVLCAFHNNVDVHHEKAVRIINEIVSNKHGKPIITDYIFDETVSVTLRKSNIVNAIELGNFILDSEIYIAKIDSRIFEIAWSIFNKESNFSFTDCTTLAFMQAFSIKNIATFDKEFKKVEWLNIIDN